MDINFGSLCEDQLEKLNKRLTSINKSFIKEYMTILYVINNKEQSERYNEISMKITDILNDVTFSCSKYYANNMKRIQDILLK